MGIINDLKVATRLGTLEALSQAGYSTSPVIFSHQNAPEPSVPYCVINPLIINQIGRSEISSLTGDLVVDARQLAYKTTYEAQVQFTFAGSNAEDLAFYFYNAVCNNRSISYIYRKNALSPTRKSTLRRSPQKRDTVWVDFWNIDVTFIYAVITKQDVDWVESITDFQFNTSI